MLGILIGVGVGVGAGAGVGVGVGAGVKDKFFSNMKECMVHLFIILPL